MGKQKQYKKLRRIAKNLPVIETGRVVAKEVLGDVLLKKGVTELKDGTPVNEKTKYISKDIVPASVNHNRNMKKYYNKGGVKGASEYAAAVIRYDSAKQKMQEEQVKKLQEPKLDVSEEKKSG